MTFDVGPFALQGTIPDANHGMGGFCPRRTVLDALLVQAAADAGADVRQGFTVDDVRAPDGGVARVRGHAHGSQAVEERARIVIGADGVHSFVARAVGSPEYEGQPPAACGYYSYFSGIEQEDIELYMRDHHAFGGAPTNGGLHLVMVNWPARDFAAVRADVEAHVWRALESAPHFAGRVRHGRRQEKWYGAAGVPGYLRKPYGPGWALVGDAGYNKDPITAQGMSDAFIDAEMLVESLSRWLSGCGRFEELLAAYEAARNERVRPMYAFTTRLAALGPPPREMQDLFASLRGNQDAINAFLSAITGAIPLAEFMSDQIIGRVVAAAKSVEVD
jgi:2-polyprenyl-6-methoxyphenol hydroxylase-like FAD-dependent oxidoreductase